MTFLCEYNVNTASPWKSKLNKETNKKESSQKKNIPLEKLLPKKKQNKDNYKSSEKNTIESKSDDIIEQVRFSNRSCGVGLALVSIFSGLATLYLLFPYSNVQ